MFLNVLENHSAQFNNKRKKRKKVCFKLYISMLRKHLNFEIKVRIFSERQNFLVELY